MYLRDVPWRTYIEDKSPFLTCLSAKMKVTLGPLTVPPLVPLNSMSMYNLEVVISIRIQDRMTREALVLG